jgi:hypothetical protein
LSVPAADLEVTAPGLFRGATEGRVVAITSAEVPLKPDGSGRYVRFYGERVGDEGVSLCLILGGSGATGVDIVDLTAVLDENGKERPTQVFLRGRNGYAAALLSVAELKQSIQTETTFTFRGQRSQVDVRVPSALASNFLRSCEQTFGSLTNSALPKADPVSAQLRSGGHISLVTKATPFGEYDAAFLGQVEKWWHLLIENNRGAQPGKVVVDFRLTQDGRITNMRVRENEAGEIAGMLCQSAILNPVPYPKWPAQMRQTINGTSREMRITFSYR